MSIRIVANNHWPEVAESLRDAGFRIFIRIEAGKAIIEGRK